MGDEAGAGAGFEFPPQKVSWLKRDVLLFNVSIGCKADELHFVYEKHPNFSAFPTLPLGLVFKLDSQEVIDYRATQGAVKIPGVPTLDSKRLVDGDRTIRMLKPLPVTSEGRDFEFRSRVVGVYDKGKAGTVVRSEETLVDTVSGEEYAKIIGSLFYVGQGGWGGPRGPKAVRDKVPEAKADAVFEIKIDETAAHLYRLNGDYNPLHATPEFGAQMGYGGIIVHGVYAYSQVAHSIVREFGGGDPESLKEISARFAGPVKPNDAVRVEAWKVGRTAEGWQSVVWRAGVVGTGRECLTDGRAVVRGRAAETLLLEMVGKFDPR